MDDANEGATWGCILPFDTQDPEFARGVEAGILWQRLETEPAVSATVTARNAEMIMRIAEARSLPFSAQPLGEQWLTVHIGNTATCEKRQDGGENTDG
jgi:hypothetical protein